MIYIYKAVKGIHACPDIVSFPDLGITLPWKNGLTFVVGLDENGCLRLLTSEDETHTRLILRTAHKVGRLSNKIEGRIWKNEGILAIWNDVASEDVGLIVKLFDKVEGVDISDFYFASEFDAYRAFLMPIETFVKLGIGNNWQEQDWHTICAAKNRDDSASNAKYKTNNSLGFDDRDYMRHYLYNEGKNNVIKINENIIKQIVTESIKKILKIN